MSAALGLKPHVSFRFVDNPYLGITSGLPVIQEQNVVRCSLTVIVMLHLRKRDAVALRCPVRRICSSLEYCFLFRISCFEQELPIEYGTTENHAIDVI